jgi:type VI secretion system protein ImpM
VKALGSGSGTQAFASGWYGKLPAAGDFVARRVPGAFCDAWGRWLQGALEGARARLGSGWSEDFLSMPVWRFVIAPGLLTPNAWAGVMVPSVDKVGRYFPLALASALPAAPVDLVATLFAARRWFDDMEHVAFFAIGPRADMAALDAETSARPFPPEYVRPAGAAPRDREPSEDLACMALRERRSGAPRAAWLAPASEIFGATLLVCDGLPPAGPFCAMMDGRWQEHGWAPCGAG